MGPQGELLFPNRHVTALRGLRGQLMNRSEATRARILEYLEHGVVP